MLRHSSDRWASQLVEVAAVVGRSRRSVVRWAALLAAVAAVVAVIIVLFGPVTDVTAPS